MYIEDVIEQVKKLCPSEYDSAEMYLWCDEVSAMLMIEDRNVFVKERFRPDVQGRILLPDGVKFENIISASVNGKSLRKEELSNFKMKVASGAEVMLVYLKPYTPIRVLSYNGEAIIDRDASNIVITDSRFRVGDNINITVADKTKTLSVLDVKPVGDGYALCVPCGTIDDLDESEFVKIERIVTDKTVCDAPYDSMYIDYIIAKICMYQRDFDTYNQFMTSFNSRLDAYKKWIINQLPQAGGKLENWW